MRAELWAEIRRLHLREGWSKRRIARQLHLDPKTVRRAVQRERYEPKRRSAQRPSKLDPFKDTVRQILARYSDISCVRILQEIRPLGYTGGVTILEDFVRTLRPKAAPEAFLRLAFPPGDAAQVDWASCGTILVDGRPRRLSAFLFVLAYSRLLYAQFTWSEDLAVFLAYHHRAFAAARGVPRRILYDNLKSVVLAHVGSEVRFNPRFLDFSAHYGFRPVACAPYRPNEKGRVENAVKYLKGNFLAGRTLVDLEGANLALCRWLDQVANVREHATTHQRPLDLWERERSLLLPLPPTPYDTRVLRTLRASLLCRVQFEGNTYSVPPAHAGAVLTLKATEGEVAIYRGADEVARHRRARGRGEDVVEPGHVRALVDRKRRGDKGALVHRFLAIGEGTGAYLKGLVASEVSLYRHMRRILALADTYGAHEVHCAMARAAQHRAYGADYVERIVHQERRSRRAGPPPGALALAHVPDLARITLPEIDLDIYDRALGTGEGHAEVPHPRSPGAPAGEPGEAGPHEDPRDLPGPHRQGDA